MKDASMPTLKTDAAEALNNSIPEIKSWIEKIRAPQPGRLKWAIETTRDANVAATSYCLGGLRKMGILDDVWTDSDRAGAEKWIQSMDIGNGQYRDPALINRKTPTWPEDQVWPSPSMLAAINQYGRNVLRFPRHNDAGNLGKTPSPPGWPQKTDPPAAMVEWIKTRPYDQNAWSACSHGMRMATWMLEWHRDGCFGLEPIIEALQFFYTIQDPDTGLWGTPEQQKHVRINGAFKLFTLLREQLDLPIPHADKIIDQVMDEFSRPDYEQNLGGCDEWDNWYVIALVLDQANGHRCEEILAMAARRICRVLEIFRQDDGGLSFFPDRCNAHWNGFDMAPEPLPQADAMGLGILTSGINVCIDLLDLHEASPWTGEWRLRPNARENDAIRQPIMDAIKQGKPYTGAAQS